MWGKIAYSNVGPYGDFNPRFHSDAVFDSNRWMSLKLGTPVGSTLIDHFMHQVAKLKEIEDSMDLMMDSKYRCTKGPSSISVKRKLVQKITNSVSFCPDDLPGNRNEDTL